MHRSRPARAAVVASAIWLCACSNGQAADDSHHASVIVQTRGTESTAARSGDQLPELQGVAHTGQLVQLADTRDRPLVLWFCRSIRDARCRGMVDAIRSRWSRFRGLNARLLGAFGDDGPWLRAVAYDVGLPFLALSDTEGRFASTFGLNASGRGGPNLSAVIADKQAIIQAIMSDTKPKRITERALDALVPLDS